jgi:hypothetical protein
MQLAQLLTVFQVDRIVVSERLRHALSDPKAVFDAGLVGLRQMLNGLLELRHVQAFVVERQACQDDGNVRMAPLSGWRWNAFRLSGLVSTDLQKTHAIPLPQLVFR